MLCLLTGGCQNMAIATDKLFDYTNFCSIGAVQSASALSASQHNMIIQCRLSLVPAGTKPPPSAPPQDVFRRVPFSSVMIIAKRRRQRDCGQAGYCVVCKPSLIRHVTRVAEQQDDLE